MYVHKYVHKIFEHSKSYIVLCAKITLANGETLQNHVCDHSKFCITLYTIILPSQIELSTRQHANRATIPLVHGYSHNMRTLYITRWVVPHTHQHTPLRCCRTLVPPPELTQHTPGPLRNLLSRWSKNRYYCSALPDRTQYSLNLFWELHCVSTLTCSSLQLTHSEWTTGLSWPRERTPAP